MTRSYETFCDAMPKHAGTSDRRHKAITRILCRMIHLTQRFTVLPPSIFAHPCCLLPQQWYATVFFPFHPIIFCFEINSCFLPAGPKKDCTAAQISSYPLHLLKLKDTIRSCITSRRCFPSAIYMKHTCIPVLPAHAANRPEKSMCADIGISVLPGLL